jgi:hypothetical protein
MKSRVFSGFFLLGETDFKKSIKRLLLFMNYSKLNAIILLGFAKNYFRGKLRRKRYESIRKKSYRGQ